MRKRSTRETIEPGGVIVKSEDRMLSASLKRLHKDGLGELRTNTLRWRREGGLFGTGLIPSPVWQKSPSSPWNSILKDCLFTF